MSLRFNTTMPAFQFYGRDLFICTQVLRYTARNGDLIEVPILWRQQQVPPYRTQRIGFLTDFGSKPWLAQIIVDDRCDEGVPAYVFHDWLYRGRFVMRDGERLEISREYADEMLDEMLEELGMSEAKRELISEGVGLGGGFVWNERPALDLELITVEQPGEDFAPLSVHVQPSFEVQEA